MENRFETFSRLIHQIEHSMLQIKTNAMAQFDLKGVHAICIYLLSENEEGLKNSELVSLSGEDKATISRALTELNNKGFLSEPNPEDSKKYNSKILLSPLGKKVAEEIKQKVSSALSAASIGVSEKDRAIMYETLSKINDNLSSYFKDL